MKILKKTNIVGIAIAFFSMLVMYSCTKDEAEKVPSVSEITLSKADTNIFLMNRYVTIKGSGFDDVQDVLFNDLETYVNPNYVTSSRILVQIPNEYPDEVTNKISLITKSKAKYDFDFTVDVPLPQINEVAYTVSKNLVSINGLYLAKPREVSIGGVIINDYTVSPDFSTISFVAPSGLPAGILKVKVVCPHGADVYDFDLEEAAKPAITEIPCEWVDEGKTMQVNGRNLALIKTLTINGIEINSGFGYNDDNSVLTFTMPSGITGNSLSIKVLNEFGRESAVATSKYKTSTLMIWDFDAAGYAPTCWGAPGSHFTADNGISGNYWLIEGTIGPLDWDQNNMVCTCGDIGAWDADITNNPGNYVVKFEINVINPWSVGSLTFSVNDAAVTADWIPYDAGGSYQSGGWRTVSMPLSNLDLTGVSVYGGYRMYFLTAGAASASEDTYICVDNIRIDTK